jgi:hypothetical protein
MLVFCFVLQIDVLVLWVCLMKSDGVLGAGFVCGVITNSLASQPY